MTDSNDPARQLWAMADLVTPMAIRVAATLRVADHTAAGPRSVAALAEATGANPGALDRLLRHLVAKGILSRGDDGRYGLTGVGNGLRASRLRDGLDLNGGVGRADLAFTQLLHSVLTGEAGYPQQFGHDFWDDLATDPARSAVYDAEMGSDVAAWAPVIIESTDWGAFDRVVDVGGGNGTLLIALLRAFPSLLGTVLELPRTAAAAQEAVAAAGLEDRATVVEGDFFDALPGGAGAYLLAAILHDWNDDSALAILRRGREAAGRDGRLFVVEKIGRDGATPGTPMDLRMLTFFGGKERSLADLTALVGQAGFTVARVHTANAISILELKPS